MKQLITGLSVLVLTTSTFAQDQAAPSGFNMGSILPMLLVMIIVMYFFMIRPEQKKQKQKRDMLGGMQKGDKAVTIGGIHGTIAGVKDDSIMLRIADNTNIKMSKSAIASITNKDEKKTIAEEKKK